jgi:hypothetical protein
MAADREELCTKRLKPGATLILRNAAGRTVMCCAGAVCIVQQGNARRIFLAAGASYTFDRPGLASIRAVEGMKDEWLGDSGITVIFLSLKAKGKT